VCASFIYSLWEDRYREAFAHDISVAKSSINRDLLGELRRYRQAIIHNAAIGTSETLNCNAAIRGCVVAWRG
jgi:hypothetical protein